MSIDETFLAFQSALAGRYSIDRELGRGGMGIVYLAHEVHLDRLVAIKLLPPAMAAEPLLRERFLREARLAARLSHPNIIPIHAVAEEGGFVFYVMAYVDGETLAHRIMTRGPLVGSDAVRVFREVSWALAHAHAHGLVHRDVKPDNILLEHGSGRALVADFGIAAAVGDASSQGVAGTPEFMSPEQASGGPVDARSDIYSLGATAFYACSGRLPFEGSTAMEVVAQHATRPPPPLRSLGRSAPRRLAALVDQCLAKDPCQRPQTADDVAEQLGLALEQRRELPVALRAFVRHARLNGGGTLVATTFLMTGSLAIAYYFGGQAGWTTLLSGAGLGSLAFLVRSARRLLKQGFTHDDIAPAFEREMEAASEELALDHARPRHAIERVLKVSAVTGITAGVASAALALTPFRDLADLIGIDAARALTRFLSPLFIIGMPVGFGSLIGHIALVQRRKDVDTSFWSRLWTGPVGKLAFGIARRSVTATVAGGGATHRATELALGFAAEQLFESLPRETRAALGDLPDVLARLQDDSRSLRRRYDRLQEALAGSSEATDGADDLRRLRDETHLRLREAIGALEMIRLSLLRLHAGLASVESLTTHLGVAADVSAQVERLIAAHDEVERELRFPVRVEPTPV